MCTDTIVIFTDTNVICATTNVMCTDTDLINKHSFFFPGRRSECLRRLVVVLTEQRRLKELCDFTYTGLEEEVRSSLVTVLRS